MNTNGEMVKIEINDKIVHKQRKIVKIGRIEYVLLEFKDKFIRTFLEYHAE